jgi:hypothetical protein
MNVFTRADCEVNSDYDILSYLYLLYYEGKARFFTMHFCIVIIQTHIKTHIQNLLPNWIIHKF